MKYRLFSWFILFFAPSGFAQTLLVSDVDDTIKLAYVQSTKDKIYFALDDTSRFMGMSELYRLIEQDNPDLQIAYLSRAPTWLMQKRHQSLLKKGAFPQGRYIGRESLSSDTHKVQALRSLIAEFQPKKVILLGDNGEADPVVYQQIADEFRSSGIEFLQFIRIVYSKSLWTPGGVAVKSDQKGFVTPIEISLELEARGLLTKRSVEKLLADQGPLLTDEKLKEKNGEYAFPYFVECSDFRWTWDDRVREFPGLTLIKNRIVKRCGLNP